MDFAACSIACVVPAFMGETHFAVQGLFAEFQETAKREMEYLRIDGGSKENAKELKLFGLAHLPRRAVLKAFESLHTENVNLAKRRGARRAGPRRPARSGITAVMPS